MEEKPQSRNRSNKQLFISKLCWLLGIGLGLTPTFTDLLDRLLEIVDKKMWSGKQHFFDKTVSKLTHTSEKGTLCNDASHKSVQQTIHELSSNAMADQ